MGAGVHLTYCKDTGCNSDIVHLQLIETMRWFLQLRACFLILSGHAPLHSYMQYVSVQIHISTITLDIMVCLGNSIQVMQTAYK